LNLMTLFPFTPLKAMADNNQALILVTGPARSGKSEWAETLAGHFQKPVIYVATARGDSQDTEWQARIAQHQQRRPEDWATWEVPQALAATIQTAPLGTCLLVDSLGTWLANCLDQSPDLWHQTQRKFLKSLGQRQGPVILVAEETGWGIVPPYPLGRCFRDRLGTLVRHVGVIANPVYLVTGGYVLNLSQLGMCLPIQKD